MPGLAELLPFLLMPVIVGVGIYTSMVGRDRVKRALRDSFTALSFKTTEGEVHGDALRVVKVYKQGMPLAYDDVFDMAVGPRWISDSFWYCVGPGGSYFLAIPLVEVGWGRVKVSWVVRPLTAERMRAALQDDQDALQDAFGGVPGQFRA